MFRRLSEPLPLSEAGLLALRPALNAPVLNVEFLPVGPARGAVVAFAEEWGGIGLALGIRANESGQVAVLRNQESIEPDVPVERALESILAEAERMGFLFDEDMVGDAQGRHQALALWGRLMGEIEQPPPPRAAAPEPAARESILVSEGPPPSHPLPPARPVENTSADGGPPSAARPAAELMLDDRVPEFDLGVEGVVVSTGPVADDSQPTQPIRTQPSPPPVVERRAQASPPAAAPAAKASSPAPNAAPAPPQPARSAAPKAPPARVAKAKTPAKAPVEAVSPAPPAPAPAPEAPPQQKLSKFRHVDEAVAASLAKPGEESSQANQLGRIPIVRLRKEAPKRAPTIARLLASF